MTTIPYLGGYNDTGEGYALPFDLDAIEARKSIRTPTVLERERAAFETVNIAEAPHVEHRIPVEGGPDMVFTPIAGQPGMFTTNYVYQEAKVAASVSVAPPDVLSAMEKRLEKLAEPEWPPHGAAFHWVKDMINADVLIELRALVDKRLRELGAMR